jgi:hypothetical protein
MPDEATKERGSPIEAYKLLVSLLQHEETIFWSRITVFLIFNTGLIAVLGLIQPFQDITTAQTSAQASRVLPLLVCCIGAVICLLWIVIVKRSEAFYNHWYEQAKFWEKEYLSPINVFQIADEYFAKGEIELGNEKFKLDFVAKRMHIYHALIALPLVFLAAWVGLAAYLIQNV